MMDNIMHNLRRQNEASRVRMDRIISGYIKIKYPKAYEEAKAFYTRLDMLYPNKKDLRKTYEYSLFATGSEDNKYKYNRSRQEGISDKMVLEIPLMDTSDIPTVIPADIPTVAPAVIPADIPTVAPAVIPADIPTVAPAVIPADIPTVAPAVIPADIPTVAPAVIPDIGAELTLPVLPDKIIDEIIAELSQDPEICNFFDDILNDEAPLESELMALGF